VAFMEAEASTVAAAFAAVAAEDSMVEAVSIAAVDSEVAELFAEGPHAAAVCVADMEAEDTLVAVAGRAAATAEDFMAVAAMVTEVFAVVTVAGDIAEAIAAGDMDVATETGDTDTATVTGTTIGASASAWDIGPATTDPVGDMAITHPTDIPTTRTIRITLLTIRTIRPTHLTGATRTAPTIATVPDTVQPMIRRTRIRRRIPREAFRRQRPGPPMPTANGTASAVLRSNVSRPLKPRRALRPTTWRIITPLP
jgi:hypothetical protein